MQLSVSSQLLCVQPKLSDPHASVQLGLERSAEKNVQQQRHQSDGAERVFFIILRSQAAAIRRCSTCRCCHSSIAVAVTPL
jgi:hypothetical protein